MVRQTALLLFAVVCLAPYFAAAIEDDADLLETPLFAADEESTAQPQRSLLTYTKSYGGSYPGSYPGGYPGGYYPGGYPGGYNGGTVCKKEKNFEVFFIATNGVIKSKATGKYRYGVYRDKVLIPQLKEVARWFSKNSFPVPWKFPVTNYSRCVVKKARAFSPKNFHCRVVCNLSDIPCKGRPRFRNALRNAAKYPKNQPKNKRLVIVVPATKFA